MLTRINYPRRTGFGAFAVGLLMAIILSTSLFQACDARAQDTSVTGYDNPPPDSNVQLVAFLVDTLRAQDSLEATDVFLVPFQSDIFGAARKQSLPPDLLAAFIQEESAYDQWATRREPHYEQKRAVIAEARAWSRQHRGLPTSPTELADRSRSYGLMQIMGQTAREQGYKARYLSALFAPFDNIEQGAIHLKNKLKRYPGDTLSAISAYNQGDNRKAGGDFANARYVYRVLAAREVYKALFSTKTNVKKHSTIRKSRFDQSGVRASVDHDADSARRADRRSDLARALQSRPRAYNTNDLAKRIEDYRNSHRSPAPGLRAGNDRDLDSATGDLGSRYKTHGIASIYYNFISAVPAQWQGLVVVGYTCLSLVLLGLIDSFNRFVGWLRGAGSRLANGVSSGWQRFGLGRSTESSSPQVNDRSLSGNGFDHFDSDREKRDRRLAERHFGIF